MIDKDLSGRLIVANANDKIVSCELDGESVILNLENGVYYGLDMVGSFIWNIIQSPRELSEIRDLILAEYDVGAERCMQDLMELLNDLASKGLVEIGDQKAA